MNAKQRQMQDKRYRKLRVPTRAEREQAVYQEKLDRYIAATDPLPEFEEVKGIKPAFWPISQSEDLTAKLLAGVEIWNTWRAENPGSTVDLNGVSLVGANLRGANLLDANLRYADLRGADLRDANLSGSVLIGAKLHGAKLDGAIFIGAKVDKRHKYLRKGAHLKLAVLTSSQLQPGT